MSSSLFPSRAPVQDFLKEYAALAERDEREEDGEDLIDTAFDDREEDEEHAEDLEDLFDKEMLDNHTDDAEHRALDAAERKQDEAKMEALARRFELRAAAYYQMADDERDGADDLLATARKAQRKQADEAAKAKAKAVEMEMAVAKKAEAARVAKKHQALADLYDDLYAEEDDKPPVSKSTIISTNAATSAVTTVENDKKAVQPGRYHIKKRKLA